MTRWKWFMRKDEPIDCTGQATAYPNRAGAYGRHVVAGRVPELPPRPAWDRPTEVFPRNRPLLTRGQEHRSNSSIGRNQWFGRRS
jgi:hypothetical protein